MPLANLMVFAMSSAPQFFLTQQERPSMNVWFVQMHLKSRELEQPREVREPRSRQLD